MSKVNGFILNSLYVKYNQFIGIIVYFSDKEKNNKSKSMTSETLLS